MTRKRISLFISKILLQVIKVKFPFSLIFKAFRDINKFLLPCNGVPGNFVGGGVAISVEDREDRDLRAVAL